MQKRLAKVTRVAANPRILCACPCCLLVLCIGAQIEQIFSFIFIQWLFFLSLCFYVSKETAERYLCFFLEQSTAVCFNKCN